MTTSRTHFPQKLFGGFDGRVAIGKSLSSKRNVEKRLEWCKNLLNCIPRGVEECYFLGRVILHLISYIQPSIFVKRTKRSILHRLPLPNCQTWKRLGEDLRGYIWEIHLFNYLLSWQNEWSRLIILFGQIPPIFVELFP